MNIIDLGLSHVMPWGIQELLLSKTIETNVALKERIRVYKAIENFLGKFFSPKLPAVICRTVLFSTLEDKNTFEPIESMQTMSALSAMAFVLSDTILCCMHASGWGSHPLYDEIMFGLVAINKKMMEGKKIFEQQQRRYRHTQQKKKGRKKGKKKLMQISVSGKEQFNIMVCGDGESCEACKLLLKKIGNKDKISMETLAELVRNVTSTSSNF